MNKVLILTGRYLPGYKDGGPVRSILNLTEWFGDKYDIRIMCLDRDHGDKTRYDGINVNKWNQVGNAQVFYTEKYNAKDIAKLSDEVDIVYCCGPYSDYAIAAMRLKKNGRMKAPLVVASMGSFSPDAFAIKGKKKQWFVKIMRLLGMFDKIYWSVTSKREEDELKAIVGDNAKCIVAQDLARKGITEHIAQKEEGCLKMMFLSRISRKKNLIVVPQILKKLDDSCKVSVDVYGIAEDEEYLNECIDEFKTLGDNIKWEYKGEIDSEGVPGIFAEYDAFIFPTLGENYGHVIAESLAAGCIPIISDRTPWLDFEDNKCGFVRKLEDLDGFAKAICELASMNSEAFNEIVNNCYKYIEKKNEDSAANSGYLKIFDNNF